MSEKEKISEYQEITHVKHCKEEWDPTDDVDRRTDKQHGPSLSTNMRPGGSVLSPQVSASPPSF